MDVNMGKVVKEIRKQLGMTQRTLAELCNVDAKTVRNLERTGRGRIGNLESMLDAMGYELEAVPKCGR